jgi:hypothetical protein
LAHSRHSMRETVVVTQKHTLKQRAFSSANVVHK